MAELESAFRYLEVPIEIRDRITSGGDPLLLADPPIAVLCGRVRPYYIYMCDQVAGAEHFRTTVEKGLEIIRALRGWTSGLAVPHFVIDAPGGGGKIPLLPEYVESISDEAVVLKNYAGQRYVYRQPSAASQPRRPTEFRPVSVG